APAGAGRAAVGAPGAVAGAMAAMMVATPTAAPVATMTEAIIAAMITAITTIMTPGTRPQPVPRGSASFQSAMPEFLWHTRLIAGRRNHERQHGGSDRQQA